MLSKGFLIDERFQACLCPVNRQARNLATRNVNVKVSMKNLLVAMLFMFTENIADACYLIKSFRISIPKRRKILRGVISQESGIRDHGSGKIFCMQIHPVG